MFELLGVTPQALFGQFLNGLINGSFYALLSLGGDLRASSTSSTSLTGQRTDRT